MRRAQVYFTIGRRFMLVLPQHAQELSLCIFNGLDNSPSYTSYTIL
jgi:hypothetical protein